MYFLKSYDHFFTILARLLSTPKNSFFFRLSKTPGGSGDTSRLRGGVGAKDIRKVAGGDCAKGCSPPY
jgi:hypothetical protein